MAYVDLNPIRANMAQTPEQSQYTSIQQRIKHKKTPLKPFDKDQETTENAIPFRKNDYIQLVQSTGKVFLSAEKVTIQEKLPEITQKLGINTETWLKQIKDFDNLYYKAIGSIEKWDNTAKHSNKNT